MILVISSTNRKDSFSLKLSKYVQNYLDQQSIECELMSLEHLPEDFAFSELYGNRSVFFENNFIDGILRAEKVLFVVPEYNGSFPGVLKTFIDAIPQETLKDKKTGILGLSAGMAGNLRGIDHLISILSYLQANTLSKSSVITGVESHFENDELANDFSIRRVNDYVDRLLKF